MKNFYIREWSFPEKFLLTSSAFLFGIVFGFLMAPIKKGMYCGNNNVNTQAAREKNK